MRKNLSADNSLFKIGLNIRQARKKRELTLSDIARHTGLSKGLLSKIENFRTLPSQPVLSAIARSLNLTKSSAELLVIYLLQQHNTKGNHEDLSS